MRFEFNNVYEQAGKIATNISRKYSRSTRSESTLSAEDFHSEMMIKLLYVLEREDYTNEEHFYKNFSLSCSRLAISLIKTQKYTESKGYSVCEIKDDDNIVITTETHRISTISLQSSQRADDGIDLASAIEDIGGESVLAKLIENERLIAMKNSLGDELAVQVLEQWIDPDPGLRALLEKETNANAATYGRAIKKHLKLTNDLYNYAKDIILSKAMELFPDDCVRLGLA